MAAQPFVDNVGGWSEPDVSSEFVAVPNACWFVSERDSAKTLSGRDWTPDRRAASYGFSLRGERRDRVNCDSATCAIIQEHRYFRYMGLRKILNIADTDINRRLVSQTVTVSITISGISPCTERSCEGR